MFQRNVNKHQDILKLQELLKTAPSGAEILYSDLENATHIVMDTTGKERLRLALKGINQEFKTINGKGIVLSSEKNATAILSDKGRRVAKANKKFVKTGNNLLSKHHEEMEAKQKTTILAALAISGAIQNALEGRNSSLVKQQPVTSTVVVVNFPAGMVAG